MQARPVNKDPDATKSRLPEVMEWLEAYTPAPSLIAQIGAYKEG